MRKPLVYSFAKGIGPMSLKEDTAKNIQPEISRRKLCMAMISGAAVLQTGCLGLASNLMHAVGMDMIPPEYEGFEEQTVAVITISDSSSYTRDQKSAELSTFVGRILTQKIKDIKVVRDDKVSHWRDTNGWDSLDFSEIGEGVEADKVLGIELSNFSLRDGPTLYCGTSDVTISVIDVATGDLEFSKSLEEYRYPTMAGQHTSETTESDDHFIRTTCQTVLLLTVELPAVRSAAGGLPKRPSASSSRDQLIT